MVVNALRTTWGYIEAIALGLFWYVGFWLLLVLAVAVVWQVLVFIAAP